MDGFECFLLGVMFLVGGCVGSVWVEDSWRTDCQNVGAHYSAGKVFTCSVKESK